MTAGRSEAPDGHPCSMLRGSQPSAPRISTGGPETCDDGDTSPNDGCHHASSESTQLALAFGYIWSPKPEPNALLPSTRMPTVTKYLLLMSNTSWKKNPAFHTFWRDSSPTVKVNSPLVTIAMREPQDLATYPTVGTHLCTYSGHKSSLSAAVDAMVGRNGFPGRLPVAIPGLYPIGHGATT